MGRLTTPTFTAPDPAARARATIGTALGIVSPSAVPLRDGRVWLTGRNDVLPAHVVRAMEAQFQRRAEDRASDDRMLAEAVGVLGAEIARARGESPEAGATDALDRLLSAPGLDQSRRTEGEAMLRLALRLAAQESQEAAARLRSLPGEARVPVATEIVSASQRISQDAGLLATNATQPSRRPRVGGSHRRPSLPQTVTREVRGTSSATSLPGLDPGQSELAALAALARLDEPALGSTVTSRPVVNMQSRLAAITTTSSDSPQYIRVEILPTDRRLTAQGRLRSGTANDPHVLRIKPGLPPHQYEAVWVHQLSLMTQQQEAARAERPTGILGKLRSAFSHERRDRRINADLAVYRKLSSDWQLAREGRPTGPLSVPDLERDIEGLAREIERRSGSRPERPWANETTYSPAAAAEGFAAERAVTAAITIPNTPGHLRQQVSEQIASLEAAVTDLERQAADKATSAADAADQGTAKEDQAEAEHLLKDRLAPERARQLHAEAAAAFSKARRHTEIGHGYQQAANAAGQALDRYRTLLGQLDDPSHQPVQIADLAREAAEKSAVYESSLQQALPVDHLESGVPTDERLDLPIDKINEMLRRPEELGLAAPGSSPQLSGRGPVPMPAAQYRRLFSDGMVFNVPGDADADVTKVKQVRARMKARNLTEVSGLDYTLAEQMSGTLGEGGQSNAITNTHSSSVSYGVDLQPFMTLAPVGSAVHAASQVFSPRADVTTGHTESVTAGASVHGQLGWVDVHKGESLPYRWDGELEIQVRNSPTEPWSPVETFDAGEHLTWVPSPYTVKAQTETVTLEQLGRGDEVTAEFPRYTATRFNGLQDINDQLVTKARERFGRIDRAGYDAISQLITEDPGRLLGDMARPGGLSRQIRVDGRPRYALTLQARPIWRDAKLVGACSGDLGAEMVQVDFAGFNASRVTGTSLSGSATLAFPGKPFDPAQPVPGYLPSPTALSDLGSTTADLSPNASAGRNVSRQGGQNVSTTAITPVVDRDMAPTQGVLVDIEWTATLSDLDHPEAEPVVVTETAEAKLRLTPADLLRTGAPAGQDAVLRDDDGAIRLDQNGRALLLGDPEPPTGPQTLPPWHGDGENQMRGPGKSLPSKFTGVEEARRQALTQLSAMGLVPPLDDDLEPDWDALRSDPRRLADRLNYERRLAGQLDNYDRVDRTIRADRIAGAMNTACQSGLLVELSDHSLGRAPRNRVFRLATTQDFDDVKPAGTSGSRFLARLGISSRATQQTSGRAKAVPISAGAGLTDGPDAGQRGWTARLGFKLSRSAIGRSFNWSLGTRVNRVTLNESTGETDHLRQGLRITFTEVTANGDSDPLADVQGSVLLPYDSTLARAEPLVFEANPMPPHPEAVSRSIPEAVDAGNPADRLFTAVDAIRADTTGFVQLHAALSSESLVSNTEWLNGRYELPLVITPPPRNPAQALADRTLLPREFKVVLRSEAVSHTFAAMNDQNTANINFTMSDVGHSSGTSASGGVSGEAGAGMADADKSALSGKLGVGRVGGTSQSTGTSQTSGEERLRVNDGVHYELIEKRRMVADVLQGDQVVQTVPLQDALVQKTLPEFEALELYGAGKFDLPLPIAADVAERYLTRKVELSPRTATAFIRRYKQEKAGVTTGLAAEHTDERLNQRMLEKTGVQESTAPTAEERVAENLDRIQQAVEDKRAVGMPESYETTLGSSQVYTIKQEGTEFDVDLMPQLQQQFDQVAPGLLADEPLLQAMLDTNLAADSYDGHLVDMFGPRGFSAPIELPVEGQALPDLLIVEGKARFEGDITVDGTAGLSKAAVIALLQKYKYRVRDRSSSHTATWSGGVEVKNEDGQGGAMSGGAGTDLSFSLTEGSSELTTTIDRIGDFDITPVYRTIVFTTEVRRIHNAGAAAMGTARWRLNRTVPAARTTAAQPMELRADLTAFVPRGVVIDSPSGSVPGFAGEFQPEHRHVDVPAGAAVESMLPYRKGAAVQDELYNRLTAHLGQRGVLGPAGLAQHQAAIGAQLKPSAMEAGFHELTRPGGLKLEPMATAGNGRTTVAVQINARPVGWQLVSEPVAGQSGSVWREQRQTKTSTTGNHLGPVTATGGAGGGIISVSGAVGEQVKEQSSDSHGTRLETSAFRNGDLVTVRVPVVYDVTVDRLTDKGRGTPETKNTTHLRDTARGEYYVRMLYHEYLEGLRQLEAGGDISLEGARLQAIPEQLGEPDLWATEYGVNAAGDREHQPYRPLLNALDQARIDRAPVVVSVRADDGKEHLYQALPDGRMAGVNDGGFGSAFATLNRDLVQMAEGRVDLRQLFNTMEPGANFSTEVADALVQSGVPDSMLKGLTYSTATRPQTPASGQGAKPTVGGTAAGRTVTSTANGPSLTGP